MLGVVGTARKASYRRRHDDEQQQQLEEQELEEQELQRRATMGAHVISSDLATYGNVTTPNTPTDSEKEEFQRHCTHSDRRWARGLWRAASKACWALRQEGPLIGGDMMMNINKNDS